ncbi:MAG: metal-dependent hydrolase [Cryobacterium sp.]|nr:metal-dependent hydrolase [Cryobacterium sp.]
MSGSQLRETEVLYPLGETETTARVLATTQVPLGIAVFLDRTVIHPVDPGWPDQPADRGQLNWGEQISAILDATLAATDGKELYFGREIPVRKGTEGWDFLVAHLVQDAPEAGAEVTVTANADYRRALSLGHTGCHLASLALNRALADRWSKEVSQDALGSPNFDSEANSSSRILEHGSVDLYRLGKSLRKRGFTTEGLAEALPDISTAINSQLSDWVAADAPVSIDREGPGLTDRRYWVCDLPEGTARIACGGTHASRLGELGSISAELSLEEVEGAPQLRMVTNLSGR